MADKIFIDATNAPIGRIASHVAKLALAGDKVLIFNCEAAVISGNKVSNIEKWKERRAKGGSALKGPYHSKDSEKILKRAIRGMLPNYKRGRGREAWKNIRCYNGIPEEYKNEKLVKGKGGSPAKYISLAELKRKL